MSEKYTVSEISRQTGDSARQVQRKLKDLINIESGKYIVDSLIVKILYPATTNDSDVANLSKLENSNAREGSTQDTEFDHVEYFTDNEYQEFHKRLSEYPLLKEQLANSKEYLDTLKNELEYHKSAYLRQLDIHEKMIDSVKQRNYIEAKEKKIE